MARRRALTRIGINVALDAALAAVAVPLAAWIVAPDRPGLSPAACAWGAAALLLSGLPFRLPLQYWRYAGVGELVGVAASSLLAAAVFSLGTHLAGAVLPSPSFPVALALCLLVLLGSPRIFYRLLREAPSPGAETPEPLPVLLLGAGDGADLFLSALAADAAPPYRALGLLSGGGAQTGRRIQNCPVLGSLADAPAVLGRLRAAGELPVSLIITEPGLDPVALDRMAALAGREGIAVMQAPSVSALARAAGFVAAGSA